MTLNFSVFLSVLLIIFSSFKTKAQTYADSLTALLGQTHNDTIYVDLLNQLAQIHVDSNTILAIDYAVKAEKIAENCNYNEGLAEAFLNIGIIYTQRGNFELALENYSKSNKILQLMGDKKGISKVFDRMGKLYFNYNKLDKALEFYNKSLSLKKELNDSVGLSDSYGKIGLVYSQQGKFDKALIQYYNSLRLKETLNDKAGMAISYINIGVIYFDIKSYDQAQINLDRALKFFTELNNLKGKAKCLLYLGQIYSFQNNNSKAIETLNECLKLFVEIGNFKGIADAYLKLGQIDVSIGKPEYAYFNFINSLKNYETLNDNAGIFASRTELANYYYYKNDLENAKFELKKALEIAIANNLGEEEYKTTKFLAKIYLIQENYFRTSEILLRANVLIDSLNTTRLNKEIAQITMQFEFEKKIQEQELEKLRLEASNLLHIQKIKMIRNISIVVVILILVIALVINKKTIESNKKSRLLEKQKVRIDRQLKELNLQKKALEKSNQTKNKFLAILGHDLRNPVNSIISFVSLLTEEQTHQLDKDTTMKYLHVIKDSGANALTLLDNLLEWAKVQSGIIKPHFETISINYVLRGNALLIKEIAQQKRIELIEQLDGNPTVNIDKNMINTVIQNLLSNALKFTDAGGKIWIKTIIKNNDVKIMIQDTGVGISDEQLLNLFEPTAINLGIDGIASSGLGLTLCQEFLLQHRQELRVDSKKNYGTTFWFYLPLTE